MFGWRSGSGLRRFERYVAGLGRSADPRLLHYPGLSARPFYDASSFPVALELERRAVAIAQEFAALDERALHRESESIARTGSWDVALLMERGKRNEPVAAACPQTMEAVAPSGCLQTFSGLAYFSRLGPDAAVAEHRGPTNVRLRCHLGIAVPPQCGLRVDGFERAWEEGRCLVFNDALPHAVWNRSGAPRVVLVVDVWHPDLSPVEIELLEGLQRYALAHARNLESYWQQNARARAGMERRD